MMADSIDLYQELRTMICGALLGSGMSRETYVYSPDPTKVIKIETRSQSFQNIAEWETWLNLNHTEAAKWLAPCVRISDCGVFLIQERVEPLRASELPKKLPTFITDTKIDNFGMYGGRIVACDYGRACSDYDMRLRKVYWRDAEGDTLG